MISFRPVVEDGVSSRREREEIWLSKTRSPLNSRKFSVRCLRGHLVPLLVQKSRRSGDCDTVLLACPCVGLRAASADLLIGTRRDPQYRSVDAIGLIALRSYPSPAIHLRDFRPPHGAPEHIECVTPPPDCFLGHGTARHDAREIRKADEISVAF